MRNRRGWLLVCGLVLVAPQLTCSGDGGDDTTTSVAAGLPTSDKVTTPTPADASTPTSEDFGTSSTATVESILAVTQAALDEEFAARANPTPEVLGAIELSCDRSGPVEAGDLLACTGTPRTAPDFVLDPVGALFAVLDEAGTVVWTTGSDLPSNESALRQLVASATPGLFCRDLVDPEAQARTGFFDTTTTNETLGYFLSVVYWFIEGRPGRMDQDGNGIPCETVHDPDVVATIWRGGSVG